MTDSPHDSERYVISHDPFCPGCGAAPEHDHALGCVVGAYHADVTTCPGCAMNPGQQHVAGCIVAAYHNATSGCVDCEPAAPDFVAAVDQMGSNFRGLAPAWGAYYKALRAAGCSKRLARQLVLNAAAALSDPSTFAPPEEET